MSHSLSSCHLYTYKDSPSACSVGGELEGAASSQQPMGVVIGNRTDVQGDAPREFTFV